jgi:outer membrane protein assembly factor BamB
LILKRQAEVAFASPWKDFEYADSLRSGNGGGFIATATGGEESESLSLSPLPHSAIVHLVHSKCLLILLITGIRAFADDWPQWLGPQRDGVWRESGIIEKFPTTGPKIRWRVPVGAGYSGPAVALGRVYLTDRQLKPGAANQRNPFDRGKVDGTERVLCLNESDGAVVWSHEYDCPYSISYAAGPRATPLVDGGKVFVLGAEGNLFCFDAETGKEIWALDFNEKYNIPTPLWGYSAHPLVDGNKLICLVGGNGSTVVAFEKNTGKELWRALSAKEPGYCPPMIFSVAGKRQLIVWHPEAINSLNPETGEVYWTEPYNVQSALSVSTPRIWRGDHLYLTAFYNGSRMYQIGPSGIDAVWQTKKASEKDTEHLNSIMSTPVLEGDLIYGVCAYGQLRCLDAKTGERIWETLAATTPDNKPQRWANAFLIKNADRYFIANEKGDLIIAKLSRAGYDEISRFHLLEPTNTAAGRDVVWSHPAFANRNVYARNDKELVCVDLSARGQNPEASRTKSREGAIQ